jgi:dolichol-phosphate mannosyltransferase
LKIRILLPTLNEAANIEAILRRIFEVVPHADVLVIDDNSPDGTASIVNRLLPEFPNLGLLLRPRPEGLGRAYLAAIAESLDRADALITMDADFSHDPGHLPALIEAGNSHDLVIGSRYIAQGGVAEWEWWRRALSHAGNFYSRKITGMPVSDMTSGFQLLRTEVLRRLAGIDIAASGYAFVIELKYRLWRNGARVTEVPIVFQARRGGESKLSSHIVREGIMTPWRLRLSSPKSGSRPA